MTTEKRREWSDEELRGIFFEVPAIHLLRDFEKDYYTMDKRAEALARLVLAARAERDEARTQEAFWKNQHFDILPQYNNAVSLLARMGYWSCTAIACNCNSFHRNSDVSSPCAIARLEGAIEALKGVGDGSEWHTATDQSVDDRIYELRAELAALKQPK